MVNDRVNCSWGRDLARRLDKVEETMSQVVGHLGHVELALQGSCAERGHRFRWVKDLIESPEETWSYWQCERCYFGLWWWPLGERPNPNFSLTGKADEP